MMNRADAQEGESVGKMVAQEVNGDLNLQIYQLKLELTEMKGKLGEVMQEIQETKKEMKEAQKEIKEEIATGNKNAASVLSCIIS
jgi:peptidoglycan hydrolase CwlO-like protein